MATLCAGDKIRLAPDFLRMHDLLRAVRGGTELYVYEVREEADGKVLVLTPQPPAPAPACEPQVLRVDVTEEITTGDSTS